MIFAAFRHNYTRTHALSHLPLCVAVCVQGVMGFTLDCAKPSHDLLDHSPKPVYSLWANFRDVGNDNGRIEATDFLGLFGQNIAKEF